MSAFHLGIDDLLEEVGSDLKYVVLADRAIEASLYVRFQRECTLYQFAVNVLDAIRGRDEVSIDELATGLECRSPQSRRALGEIVRGLAQAKLLSIERSRGTFTLMSGGVPSDLERREEWTESVNALYVPRLERSVQRRDLKAMSKVMSDGIGHPLVVLPDIDGRYEPTNVREALRAWGHQRRARRPQVGVARLRAEALQRLGLININSHAVGVRVLSVDLEADLCVLTRCYLFEAPSPRGKEWMVRLRRSSSRNGEAAYSMHLTRVLAARPELTQMLTSEAADVKME